MKQLLSIFLVLFISPVWALPLRSFVALPVAQGDAIFRFIAMHNEKSKQQNTDVLAVEAAYGISSKHMVMLGMPYRLSPSGANQTGDVSALYRYTIFQKDQKYSTHRIGLLGGGLIPTNENSDGAAQFGFTGSYFHGRHEIDYDAVWVQGFQQSKNQAIYDISWQYRLYPEEHPEWGLFDSINLVMEYNGRYKEGNQLVHQATTGLQWVHPQWVLEGGISQNINASHDRLYLMSLRIHI